MPGFHGFPPEAITFFNHLQDNNNKPWFDVHKPDYQKYVMDPAQGFIEEMGAKLKQLSPGIHADPRINRSIFRIYRDTRFLKDVAQPTQV